MNIHRFDELENRFSTRFTIFQCCDAQALSVIECNPNIRLLWYVWWWFEKKIISMAPSSFQCLRIRPNNTFFKKFHRIDENERFLFSLKAFYIISFATHHECHSVLSVFIRIHHSPTLPPDLLTIFFFRLKCFPLLSVNKSSFSHFKPYTTKMKYAVEKEEENFFFCIVVVIWELFVAIKTLQTFASMYTFILLLKICYIVTLVFIFIESKLFSFILKKLNQECRSHVVSSLSKIKTQPNKTEYKKKQQ